MTQALVDERKETYDRPYIDPATDRAGVDRDTNQHDMDDEYRVERGDFVAVVEPHENQYSFSVRDMRRERPTIHGYGIDFPRAVNAVTQLLDALTAH